MRKVEAFKYTILYYVCIFHSTIMLLTKHCFYKYETYLLYQCAILNYR